jgi:NAD-dependent dihydropyrimidine dehydrogenase PreA subunit
MRGGYKIRRRGGSFTTVRDSNVEIAYYILSYGTISRSCSKGVFQFALSQRQGMSVPHIFFTCPKCGAINKDFLSINTIRRNMEYGNGLIRTCHNCGKCRIRVSYKVRMSFQKLKEKYDALLKPQKKEVT